MKQIYNNVIYCKGTFFCSNTTLAMSIKDFMAIMSKDTQNRDPDEQEDWEVAWGTMRAMIPEIKEQNPEQVYADILSKIN